MSRVLLPGLVVSLVFGSILTQPACRQVKQRMPVVAYSDDGDYLEPQYGTGLVADRNSPVPDVPKPIGFVLVRSKSSAGYEGDARSLTHIYQGRADLDELKHFYAQQLNRSGWQRFGPSESPIFAGRKGPETLNLSLAGDGKRSTVTVVIYPTPAS